MNAFASSARRLLRDTVVKVAISNLGYGEVEANNRGPIINEMGGKPGQEWCALFAGWCYRRAYELADPMQRAPLWCWRDRARGALEVGAKALIKALARQPGSSGLFKDPEMAEPGDLICWHRRTGPISWQGHVGVVEYVKDGLVHTIEGNVGAVPAKVKRLVHDVSKERLFGMAGLR